MMARFQDLLLGALGDSLKPRQTDSLRDGAEETQTD